MNNFYRIITIRFHGKRIDWKAVEESMSHYKGKGYIVENYGDTIIIGSRFPDEYCGSLYTKKLRGALLKAKANASTIIPDLIARASNRRWIKTKMRSTQKMPAKGGIDMTHFFRCLYIMMGERLFARMFTERR